MKIKKNNPKIIMLTLEQIYQLAIKKAIKTDLRGEKAIKKLLQKTKSNYQKLSSDEKAYFDQDSLSNPYADSKILFGNAKKKIKNIMVGVDIDSAELLLADHLNKNEQKAIDLVITHHPSGRALVELGKVMHLQEDIMTQLGVPVNIMEKLMEVRISEIDRSLHPLNHQRAIDTARILNLPFMCLHTVADNLVHHFVEKYIQKNQKKYETLNDVIKSLYKIPEYHEAAKMGAGPKIYSGKPDSKPGRIAVTEMTGGTSGAKETYAELARAGVGTILSMHINESYRKEGEKNHLNVIVCGHMASDSIGLNQLMDELEKKKIHIIPVSGFIRVSRIK